MSAMHAAAKPVGVILAGGRSQRMGGQSKALIPLQDKPLLSHVIARLKGQVDGILLSCETGNSDLESFALPLVPDLLPAYRGPLTGLCSALQYLADRQDDKALLLCPCDAPFIPLDLAAQLLAVADEAGVDDEKPVVVVSCAGHLQPTFSLWQQHHLPAIHEAVVNRGDGGLKYMLDLLPRKIIEWLPTTPPAFYNVNTPEELETASQWLESVT